MRALTSRHEPVIVCGMQSRDFCYWLQGFFEISGETKEITADQVEMIKKHLNMVFEHEIDPSFGKSAEALKKIHEKDPPVTRPARSTFDPHSTKIMC